jgi:hypothetical protein
MYGDKEITTRAVHIHHATRTQSLELLQFDTLRGIDTKNNSERVYRPNYAEIDRITIHMIIHERTRTINDPRLRTDDRNKEFAPRTRKTDGMAENDGGEDGSPPATRSQRQSLLRRVLTIYYGGDGRFDLVKSTEFNDKAALKEY